MTKEIHKTKYAIYYLDEVNSVLTQKWTNSNSQMNEEEYKIDMLNYLKYVEEYKTRRALIDTKKFGYSINPKEQEWIDNNIAIKANTIVEKIAFILPTNIFEKVSIEQTMNETKGKEYKYIKYFSTKDEALNWLTS